MALRSSPRTPPAGSAVKNDKPIAKGNVLIVEDDPDTSTALAVSLIEAGYGVRAEKNREDAAATIARYFYSTILLDYFMPGLSAKEFIAIAAKQLPDAKIVLITAGEQAKKISKELGLDYWIGKPFTPEQVLDYLHDIEKL